MKEIASWSYDPACELDDEIAPRSRVHSEPSSSETEPPINSVLSRNRGGMCGSDTEVCASGERMYAERRPLHRAEVCTPIKLPGLDPHSCQDSPFQKAHSLSVILKSPDIRRFQSKLKPCRNPEPRDSGGVGTPGWGFRFPWRRNP